MLRTTVERATSLDVNWLNREEIFDGPGGHSLSWSTDAGEVLASIAAFYRPDRDVLELRYSKGDGRVGIYIDIEWTECHFGGERPWFNCPECEDRVGTLHLPPRRSRFACRDCHDLLYDSQTYSPPLVQAIDRHDDAFGEILENGFSREALRELHAAKGEIAEVWNDHNERLDKKFGDHRDYEAAEEFHWEGPDGFQKWADDFLEEIFTKASGRSYGYHGRCTATSKTTGIRCRQPARGDSGKCYYHGGARGSGIGEGQTNHTVEQARAIIESADADLEGPAVDAEAFLASDVARALRELRRDKAHV